MGAVKVVINVEMYREVRRRWLNGESQRHIATTMGISRNTVKKYCKGDAVPWERKAYSRDANVLTREVKQFIEDCIKSDQVEGTGKQKHTYIVTYKGEGSGEGICLSYNACGYGETVSYDRTDSGWQYNSTDIKEYGE